MYVEDLRVDKRVQKNPRELDDLDFCQKSEEKKVVWIFASVSHGPYMLESQLSPSHQIYHTAHQRHGAFDIGEFVSIRGLCGEKLVVASCPLLFLPT